MNKSPLFAMFITAALTGFASASAWSDEPAPDGNYQSVPATPDELRIELDHAYATIEALRIKLLNSLEEKLALYKKIVDAPDERHILQVRVNELTAERDGLRADLAERNEQLATLNAERQTDSVTSVTEVVAEGDANTIEIAALQVPELDDAVLDLQGVKFRYDSHELTADSKQFLDRVAGEISQYPELRLEVAGHTDTQGDPIYNQWLSLKRAEAVRDYIVSQGVNPDYIGASGYGGQRPVADNSTREGLRMNRRVELRRLQPGR